MTSPNSGSASVPLADVGLVFGTLEVEVVVGVAELLLLDGTLVVEKILEVVVLEEVVVVVEVVVVEVEVDVIEGVVDVAGFLLVVGDGGGLLVDFGVVEVDSAS
jgi:hypothetical protein